MAQGLFSVKGSILRLERNPELTDIELLKVELFRLVRESPEGATLDMTPMTGINSLTVGMAVAVHLRAVEAGRKLKVRIRREQKRIFEITMLTNTLSLEVAGAGAG
jgi:hypothetical protein